MYFYTEVKHMNLISYQLHNYAEGKIITIQIGVKKHKKIIIV